MPGLAALLIKMLEFQDPLTSMKTIGEGIAMLRGLSGGTEKSSL